EAVSPSDHAAYELLKEQLEDVLDTLTDREENVLRLRFGLDDGRTRTLEEVGKVFGVTRERIRQIEAKALRKLRHPSRSKRLKDFLEELHNKAGYGIISSSSYIQCLHLGYVLNYDARKEHHNYMFQFFLYYFMRNYFKEFHFSSKIRLVKHIYYYYLQLHKEEVCMKKNILPFGIIAIVGIFAAIIIFYVGVDQRKDIQ